MEGVGARLGRSSTRYGPATVFTGPVRKWKKKWVNVPPSNSNHHHHAAANGAVNGSNVSSHLLFYKWTPIIASQNKDGNNNNGGNDSNSGNADSNLSNKDDAVAVEEPPRRKFKYIPVNFSVIYLDLNLVCFSFSARVCIRIGLWCAFMFLICYSEKLLNWIDDYSS